MEKYKKVEIWKVNYNTSKMTGVFHKNMGVSVSHCFYKNTKKIFYFVFYAKKGGGKKQLTETLKLKSWKDHPFSDTSWT